MQAAAGVVQFAPAPRVLPRSLQVRLLFGGVGWFGWVFLGGSTIGVWLMLPNTNFHVTAMWGTKGSTTGIVTEVEQTAFRADERAAGEVGRIYRYRFSYKIHGEVFKGASYSTGRTAHAAGDAVEVEYLVRNPARARIVGLRHATYSSSGLLVFVHLTVGAGIVLYQVFSGRRSIALLRDGQVVPATRLSTGYANVAVNDEQTYKVRYAFVTDSGSSVEAIIRTSDPKNYGRSELLLYHPAHPGRAAAIQRLPGSAQLSSDGRFVPMPGALWLLLPVPVLTVVANVVMAVRYALA